MEYDMKDVRKKFLTQRNRAKVRGIEFKMTFDEWWEIWKPHWHNRGSKVGQFVMCRKMDKGPYEIGNVRIAPIACNARDRSYVIHDRHMKAVKEKALSELVAHEHEDSDYDEEESWLPDEMKNPYRSSADLIY